MVKPVIKIIDENLLFRSGRCIKEDLILIKKYHYSKRPIGTAIIAGSFRKRQGLTRLTGKAVALCIFCNPVSRWAENRIAELLRLVRHDNYQGPPLTKLISMTIKELKKLDVADLLVSYADSTQNHHGGIYQACSWHYHGLRKVRSDGLIINGKFIPARSCNAMFKTRSIKKLKRLRPDLKDVREHYDKGKHLYWKPLNKEGKKKAERLKIKSIPYPKPQENDKDE